MKLRTKFFMIYSFLAILPLCAVIYFSYYRYEQNTWQRMDEYSNTIFHNAVSEANATLNSISQSISFLTFYSNETEYSIVETLKTFADESKSYTSYDIFKANQYCNSIFQNLMVSNESIHGIYLFTPTGVVFNCSNEQYSRMTTNYDPTQDSWYQDTIDLEGKYYISTNTSEGMFNDSSSSIYFARSVIDIYTHKFLGIILVDCDPEILDLTNINVLPDMTLLSIENEKNNIVLYSNVDGLNKDFFRSDREVKKTSLSIAPLTLTASFNYDALFDTYNLMGPVLLALALICILGYLILTYLTTKSLVAPLEHLSKTMSKQDEHNLSFSSPYMNKMDEIGTLYNEYARMLETLDTSIKRNYKDKLILLDAQMKSLEARINSHFLFNTLESITSMAELDDNEQISTMSIALGNMFRYSIKTQSELVTLEEELHHVQDYVSIQQIRFSNRFSLRLNIPGDLYQEKVLKLILQPLVENALYHGLNYCTRGDIITISARKQTFNLCLTISDNGQGMTKETRSELQKKLLEEATFTELGHRNKQSIGLKNIHSRIELYYGKGYGLQIESEETRGTRITILIPVMTTDTQSQSALKTSE